MRLPLSFFLWSMSFLLLSCQGLLESNHDDLNFHAFNSNGQLTREGTIEINTTNPENVTGTWHIRNLRTGETFESGALKGYFQNDQLFVDLFPGFVDNNFLLRGTYSGGIYKGTWEQIGFPGVMDSGNFIATH